MDEDVVVHPRVYERHPELDDEDVLSAWKNALTMRPRLNDDGDRLVVIGSDQNGRLIEMVASRAPNGMWTIFHAMTPPSNNTLVELGITRR